MNPKSKKSRVELVQAELPQIVLDADGGVAVSAHTAKEACQIALYLHKHQRRRYNMSHEYR